MADEKIKAEDVKEKPVPDAQKDELPEAELEKITGGNIGSQSSGAGAGKIPFNPF
jgi:hypothetical protein